MTTGYIEFEASFFMPVGKKCFSPKQLEKGNIEMKFEIVTEKGSTEFEADKIIRYENAVSGISGDNAETVFIVPMEKILWIKKSE